MLWDTLFVDLNFGIKDLYWFERWLSHVNIIWWCIQAKYLVLITFEQYCLLVAASLLLYLIVDYVWQMALQVKQGSICPLVWYFISRCWISIVFKLLIFSFGFRIFVSTVLTLLVIEFSPLSWCQSCITQLSDFFVIIGILFNDDILRILTSCHTRMQPNYWISKSSLLSFLRWLLWWFLYLCLCNIFLPCWHYEMLRWVPRIIFTTVLYRLNAMYSLYLNVSSLVELIVLQYWKLRSILWLSYLLLIS